MRVGLIMHHYDVRRGGVERYTAMNLDHAVVVRREVPCGPCHLKVCPLDHRCMTRIAPADVVEAAEAALATRARSA